MKKKPSVMKSKLYTSFLFLSATIFASLAMAQSPGMLWHNSYGGSTDEQFSCFDFTSDGGYIIGGYSTSSNGDVSQNQGNGDYWVVKSDAAGNLIWERSYGGSADEWIRSIQQTSDDGYIVAGVTYSDDGDVSGYHDQTDAWILKLDPLGNIIWQRCLGGELSEDPCGIVQTTDGGYVVISLSSSHTGDVSNPTMTPDYWMVKLDSAGNISWDKSIDNGGSSDYPMAMKQTTDGGFIVAGTTNGFADNWIVKLDPLGNVEWDQVLGGSQDDIPRGVDQVIDGGFVVAGSTQSMDGDVQGFNGAIDFWVLKFDSAGNLLWTNALGGSLNDYPWGICHTADGGCIAIGTTNSSDGDVSSLPGMASAWLVNLDAAGNLIDEVALGGSYGEDGRAIRQMSNGEFIFVGTTMSTTGSFSGNQGGADAWLVHLQPWIITGIDNDNDRLAVEVYPNPAIHRLNVVVESVCIGKKYMLLDAVGKIVMGGTVDSDCIQLDMSHCAKGIYYIKVGSSVLARKIIKL